MRNAEHLDEALLVDCSAASSEAPAEEQVLANGEVRKEPVGLEDEAERLAKTVLTMKDGRIADIRTPA